MFKRYTYQSSVSEIACNQSVGMHFGQTSGKRDALQFALQSHRDEAFKNLIMRGLIQEEDTVAEPDGHVV